MDLLILYFTLAITISFICSILESVLLSVNFSYVAVLEKESPKVGKLLRWHKENINKSIASILILNTIANTLGAAGVGAQAEAVFGGDAIYYVSVILTFAILFFSEIIPKTIGAVYWKSLAPLAAYVIKFFIFITYPIMITTLFVTNRISNGQDTSHALTKEELLESALHSEDDGILDEQESDVIENVLSLNNMKVEEILTPRSVMFALDENLLIKDVASHKDVFQFSRIPIYDEVIDKITGVVLTKQIFKQLLTNDTLKLKDIKKDIFKVNENIPVSKVLTLFIRKKEHMFLVVDNYDQTEGIITLEDCVETILGVEIMDESDSVEDMRELAKQKMKSKRKSENTHL